MMLLLGYVAGLRAASFTYTLTTHTDGRTITGTANLAEGASLEDNMPQALEYQPLIEMMYTDT